MTSVKNPDKLSLQTDNFNAISNNKNSKTIINSDLRDIKQDLLFFKNDVLKDIRKMEEKLNSKLTEQSLVNNEQYEVYEKKLDILSTKLTNVNTIASDNSELIQKINALQAFKGKTEDSLSSLSIRIINVQKESRDSVTKLDKMFEENIKYPGLIGRNSKFHNFRAFIDYVMKNIKLLNEFKEEIQDFEFEEFKRKINSDLKDLRFLINDNYKNTKKLIENNIKDLDNRYNLLNENSNKKFEENEENINQFKNKIYDFFNKYEEIMSSLEENLNKKYTEHLKEINYLKNMVDKFSIDIENIKTNLTKNGKYIEYLKNTNENNNALINSIKNEKKTNINNLDNKIFSEEKNDKEAKYRKLLLRKKKNSKFPSPFFDNFGQNLKNVEEKTNSDNSLEYYKNMRRNKINLVKHSKSFEEKHNKEMIFKYYYSLDYNDFKNTKENFAKTQYDNYQEGETDKAVKLINDHIKNSINKMSLNKYESYPKRPIFPNNYSITNIANIKVKKVVLPETATNQTNFLKMAKSPLLGSRVKRVMSNNNPSISNKYFLQNNDSLNNCKTLNSNALNTFNITKINKHNRAKVRSAKFISSARIISRRPFSKQNENRNSLALIQPNKKNVVINSANNLGKNTVRNWSFEKKKKRRDEKVQIGFKNKYNLKNEFKELLLVNTKNLKKNRKIKL